MRLHAAGNPRRGRLLHSLQWLVAAGAFGYLIWTLPGVRGDAGYSAMLDAWLGNAVLVGAAGVCLLRGLLIRAERTAWLALAAGIALWTSGRVVYLHLHSSGDVPIPSLADVGWLAFYPAVYLAIVLLVRSRIPRFHASMWLDGLVAGLAVAAVVAAILLDPIVDATGGDAAEVAVTLAYPLADLLLLGVTAGVAAAAGGRPGRCWQRASSSSRPGTASTSTAWPGAGTNRARRSARPDRLARRCWPSPRG